MIPKSGDRFSEKIMPPDKNAHRRPNAACKPLKTIQVRGKHKCDVHHIIRPGFPPSSATIGSTRQRRLPRPAVRVKGLLLQCRKLSAIERHRLRNPTNLTGIGATNWRALENDWEWKR